MIYCCVYYNFIVEMTKISVVVTTYNRPKYLSETLDAIFSQTHKNFEVILVDDGSKDNYVDAYSEKYPELIIIKKVNAGHGAARNTGVAHSSGEWVAFCDDDDVWLPEKLERQVEAIDYDAEAGLIHGRIEHIDADGKRLKTETLVDGYYYYRRGHVFLKAIEVVLVKSPTPIIKRTVFDEIGGFNEQIRVGEDVDFFMKAAFYTKFLYLDVVLAKYRTHSPEQLSFKKAEYLLITPFLLEFVKEKRNKMNFKTYLAAKKAIVRRHLWELNNNKKRLDSKTFFYLTKIYLFFIFDIKSLKKIRANLIITQKC